MSVLLTCDAIEKSFGSRTVFSDISLSLHDGERLGIIGPNGAGKSTFLQILGGGMSPDDGTVSIRKGVRLAMVVQDPRFDPEATVREVILASARAGEDKDLEASKIISRVGFEDPAAKTATLSGGWRKRLAIAAALAEQPDVLLLDEPTNHLDVEGILWLEKLVGSAAFASIFVTHDRYFLENCATRVAEINRAYPLGLFAAPGNYSRFLEKRSEFLRAQAKEQQALENLVQREIEWLRRGATARTSKSKARIQDAFDLQDQLADVSSRNKKGTSAIDFTATGRMTKRLLACEDISKSMGGRLLFAGLKFALGTSEPGSVSSALTAAASRRCCESLRAKSNRIRERCGAPRGLKLRGSTRIATSSISISHSAALSPRKAIRSSFAIVRSMSPAGRPASCSGRTSSNFRSTVSPGGERAPRPHSKADVAAGRHPAA